MKLNAARAIPSCYLYAFLLLIQASPADARSADARPTAAAAESMAAAIAPSKDDRPAIAAGIEALLDFVAGKRGKDAAVAMAAMRDPSELSALLKSKYGATVYEEALEAFAAWDQDAAGPEWSDDKAARLETDHFIIVAMSGSAAYRDREYLARFLERVVKDIENLVAPSGETGARLERNLASARTNKIVIALTRGTKDSSRPGAAGEASFGLTLSGRALVPTASIKTPYYNALSTASLASEIAHLVDVCCKFDMSGAPPLPEEGMVGSEADRMRRDLSKWAESSFERIIPYGKGLNEGFAEYVADRVYPLRNALFGKADAVLALTPARPHKAEDILERKIPAADRRAAAFLSVERDSFITYLVSSRGLERFLDFYMNVSLDEKRFRKIYGKGFKEAQAEWRSSLGA